MIGDLTDSPEPMEIKLFSQDPALLKEWGTKIGDKLKKTKGVVDVKDGIEDTISGSAILMQVDPVVAARAGFSPQEIELDASAILQGEPAATPVIVNDRSYTIRVRFPASTRANLDQIRNTVITSAATGKPATLGSLAEFTDEAGQTEIIRENLQRRVAVTGRFEGMSLGKGMEMVQKIVADMEVPPSIRVVYGGTYQEQQKSFRRPGAGARSWPWSWFSPCCCSNSADSQRPRRFSLPRCSPLPAFSSRLLITHTTFNVSSFMGLIMVIGIVAKNGILLLDADAKFRAQGADPRHAMIEAGARRLRPIMMTALATIAGMIPLSLAIGQGSQMLQPLAIAVIGGILASMIVSLVVTPVVNYYLAGRANARA